jgi:hypothetical protein
MNSELVSDVKFNCGQLEGANHHSELWALLELAETTHDFVVVCERFEYRNRSRAGLELISRDYIGVTTLFSQQRHVKLVMQTAAMAKGFVQDRHIKKLGLWSPGNPHAMDGYRHLLYYVIHNTNGRERTALLEKGWK